MNQITKLQLKELMERANAAYRKEPWIQGDLGRVVTTKSGYFIAEVDTDANASHIAATHPQVILDLCERLVGLQEELERMSKGDTFFSAASSLVAKNALEKYGIKNE